mmetsp:Transcript_59222/g.166749  ORF Transcript_59222/g.166749 Transcript_59222/m.166749 type:complete len:223 (-) Transcript_59222:31-699(-)
MLHARQCPQHTSQERTRDGFVGGANLAQVGAKLVLATAWLLLAGVVPSAVSSCCPAWSARLPVAPPPPPPRCSAARRAHSTARLVAAWICGSRAASTLTTSACRPTASSSCGRLFRMKSVHPRHAASAPWAAASALCAVLGASGPAGAPPGGDVAACAASTFACASPTIPSSSASSSCALCVCASTGCVWAVHTPPSFSGLILSSVWLGASAIPVLPAGSAS